jgi:hypothetical protein
MTSSVITELYNTDSIENSIESEPVIVPYNNRTVLPLNNMNLYEINSANKDKLLSIKKQMQIINRLDKMADKPAYINLAKYKSIVFQMLGLLKNITLVTPIQDLTKQKLIDDFIIQENKVIKKMELLHHQLVWMMNFDRSYRANKRRRTVRAMNKVEKLIRGKSQPKKVENSVVDNKIPYYFDNTIHLDNLTFCPNQSVTQNNVNTNQTLFCPHLNSVNTKSTLFISPMNNGDTINPLSYSYGNNGENNSSFCPHINNVDINNTLFCSQTDNCYPG